MSMIVVYLPLFSLLVLQAQVGAYVDSELYLSEDPEDVAVSMCKNDCITCYKGLVKELLKDDRNFYNLQRTFFPPNSVSPVFVTITYQYDNDTFDDKIFFWSSAIYFIFHPVRVFQFTSLLFSDPALRYDETVLFLPSKCYGTNDKHMILLTQRVS